MSLWRLFYHVVFATDGRQALLRPDLRPRLVGAFRRKAEELGCRVHAINCQPDHVHLALSIPPTRAVTYVIAQLKGAVSHLIGHELLPGGGFGWQRGYGVFSYSERDLTAVVRYVNDQDLRHASGRLSANLERTDDGEDAGPVASGALFNHAEKD